MPFDVAIILGARIKPDGTPGPALSRRVAHGIALVEAGLAARLLMSGGAVAYPRPEAELMRDLARAAGLAPDQILIETASRSTIGNARHCQPIIAAAGWRDLALVTDACHLPRALYAFRHFGLAPTGLAASQSSWRAWTRERLALPWTALRLELGLGDGK